MFGRRGRAADRHLVIFSVGTLFINTLPFFTAFEDKLDFDVAATIVPASESKKETTTPSAIRLAVNSWTCPSLSSHPTPNLTLPFPSLSVPLPGLPYSSLHAPLSLTPQPLSPFPPYPSLPDPSPFPLYPLPEFTSSSPPPTFCSLHSYLLLSPLISSLPPPLIHLPHSPVTQAINLRP